MRSQVNDAKAKAKQLAIFLLQLSCIVYRTSRPHGALIDAAAPLKPVFSISSDDGRNQSRIDHSL